MGLGGRERLTDAIIEALPIDGKDRLVFEPGAGFGIRVTPNGAKLFIAQARAGGRPRRVSVGRFPDMSVAKARRAAVEAVADLRAGRDPKAEKATRAKALAEGQITVAEFADEWLAQHVDKKLKPRTAADYRQIVEQWIKPAIGHLLISKVDKADVMALHESMGSTPRRANYVVRTIGALMTYAEDKKKRPPNDNPARKIKMFREGRRERFMSEQEIGRAADAITRAERAKKIGPHAAAGLRLALFTGARSGEVTAIRWDHVYWDRKIVQLPDSKTNEPRTIHLSDAALEVLETVPRVGKYVIAGAKQDEPFKNLSRSWIVARAYGGLGDVRLHDLRHSYASLAAGRGVSLQMIGKLLGHKVPATTLRYAHLRQDAVSAINDEISAVMVAAIEKQAQPSAAIVKFSRRARSVAQNGKRRRG
jgi:integrase